MHSGGSARCHVMGEKECNSELCSLSCEGGVWRKKGVAGLGDSRRVHGQV